MIAGPVQGGREGGVQYNAHLHAALQQHDVEWTQMALHFGADPNCVDDDGNGPLHVLLLFPAAENDGLLIYMLMTAGARIDLRNKAGQTPLDLAEALDRWDLALEFSSHNIDTG